MSDGHIHPRSSAGIFRIVSRPNDHGRAAEKGSFHKRPNYGADSDSAMSREMKNDAIGAIFDQRQPSRRCPNWISDVSAPSLHQSEPEVIIIRLFVGSFNCRRVDAVWGDDE